MHILLWKFQLQNHLLHCVMPLKSKMFWYKGTVVEAWCLQYWSFYTDGGPEHRTTYLPVNITMIALQKSLNLDLLLTVRAARGSSYRNPSERVNCILNLGLYGIGVMRQKIFDKPEFERKLCHCSNVDDVQQLVKENPAVNTELVRRACADTISLIRSVFDRLVLKDNKFATHDPMKRRFC